MASTPKGDQLRALREARFTKSKAPATIDRIAVGKEALAETASPNASPNGPSRNAKWRETHRDQYNQGQKLLMQRKRKRKQKCQPDARQITQ